MEDKKTSIFYRIVRWFVWLFTPKFTIEGEENLPEEGCVIVGNHSHMYGPITGELYTPGRHYIWCAGEMMNKKEVAAYAYHDFWSHKRWAFRWFYKILSYLISPLSEILFTNAHTIAVYHDTRIISTFKNTIARLQEGNKIVIFPEHYQEHNNIINDFQNRFIDLAKMYYKKTGQELSFVPMYLAPKLKKIYYGKPIRYDPSANIADERDRICNALMDSITDMAISLPEHTVIPYPNIAKKKYPKNIPLEIYTA